MNEYSVINTKYHAKKIYARHSKTGKGILSPRENFNLYQVQINKVNKISTAINKQLWN